MKPISWPVAAPTAEQWGRVPVRFSMPLSMVPAWMILIACAVGTFIAERAWEAPEEPLWLGGLTVYTVFEGAAWMSMMGLVFGCWVFARFAVLLVPLVLTGVAYTSSHTGETTAGVWWVGAALTTIWLVVHVVMSVRQLHYVAKLAKSAATTETMALGATLQTNMAKAQRYSINWAFGLTIAAVLAWTVVRWVMGLELGKTSQELDDFPWSALWALPALALSVLAVGQIAMVVWRAISRAVVGNYVWQVPPNSLGPVMGDFSSAGLNDELSTVKKSLAEVTPGCLCWTESQREDHRFDDDEDVMLNPDADLILATDYCVHHGIDAVNSLTPQDFKRQLEKGWLWSEHTRFPLRIKGAAQTAVLVGFAGHGFTGMIADHRWGAADVREWDTDLAWERESADADVWGPEDSFLPLGGEVDRIDLHDDGWAGFAVRFKHERAWFLADERMENTELSL